MPVHLGRNAFPATLGLMALALLAIGVPVWTIMRWLWIGGAEVWDFGEHRQCARARPSHWRACAAALTTVLAFPVAWVAVRSNGVLARAVEGANYVTSSLPGIVTALALVTVAIHFVRPLYQSVPLIVFAYVLLFMPRALVNVRAGLAQVPPGLEEASRSLGRSPTATFFRVTLRLTAPAAAAAAVIGIRRRGNRIDGHAAAGPHRHQNAVDAVLVFQQRAGLRVRRTVRVHARRARHSADADPVPAVDEGGRAVTSHARHPRTG